MANVTDPLARTVHGTNPQNLIEYITRQKIYDSLYWKEHCFGLSAADVAAKAATDLKAVGGSYGGNNRPTRFLCLTLKLLQIQPEEGIIASFIENRDFSKLIYYVPQETEMNTALSLYTNAFFTINILPAVLATWEGPMYAFDKFGDTVHTCYLVCLFFSIQLRVCIILSRTFVKKRVAFLCVH